MAIAAKQLLYQEIIEKLHVKSRKTNRRIDVGMNRTAALQLRKLRREAPAQVVRQAVEHFAEVAILKLEYVDVHQQPEVVMIVHHLLDLPAEANERLGLQRLVDLVEDRAEATVDGRLILADDRTEDLLFGTVIVVNVTERRPCPGGDVAHRGGVKALLDKELPGRLFDTALVLLYRAGTEFWHPPIKTNVRILFRFAPVSSFSHGFYGWTRIIVRSGSCRCC